MLKILSALALTALAAGPLGCASNPAARTRTPDEKAVMVVVHQFVDGFNAGNTARVLATCADQMSILDEFPPHEWHGAGAGSRWISDYDADAKKNGITNGIVELGAPLHIDVTADHAYVVAPADYVFKLKGTPTRESGAMFTLTLEKATAGWRITGWAWTKGQLPPG